MNCCGDQTKNTPILAKAGMEKKPKITILMGIVGSLFTLFLLYVFIRLST